MPAPGDARPFVTIVNSDLKGSTALGERLDPETLREVLTLYFDEMQAVFEAHGGTIEKIIGDAIVAVFGLPVRHEDDALRAVEAAAESQQALATLNDRLEGRWGVRLVVRTGVASGEVVFGEDLADAHVLTGDTMRVSSAMEQHAPPLEVLLAESTHALVRDHVEVEPAEPVTPKGLDLPVPAYRLVSVATRHAVLPGAGAGDDGSPASAGLARESRKTVTIVFADPKPTTLGGGPPTPEVVREVMSRYFAAMRDALEAHGGTVEKFIGDAVMAVFGLPVRHEDDAVRAVRAAAAMQAALPELNEEFRTGFGLELGNHIGVNTGEVIAGDASRGQRLVTGDAVNTAARLEGAAGAAEVILGELTWRLARDHLDVEAIPPLTLKGKSAPVAAYRLVSIRRRPAERESSQTPFVGREAEMGRLLRVLGETSAVRGCRLVTVIGDAGVGKSRLIREFAAAAAAARPTRVVRGRCLPYGDGITFWPIAEIVREAAGIEDDDPPPVAVAKIAAIASESGGPDDEAAAIADRVAVAIGLSSHQFGGDELFWAIRRLLETMAHRQALLAIVDDIHAAAPTFLELVDHLVDAVDDAPILLLATARHELTESHEEWATAHAESQIALAPLSADQADAILDGLLTGLDAAVRSRIVAAAEGNPLYVEQITSMLVETGTLRHEGDRWIATMASEDLAIPPTVEALVAARLDALGNEERAVIEPASVVGLTFPDEAVVSLVEPDIRPTVPDRLGTLTVRQFVRPTEDEDVHRFGHAVIKDTAYGSLLKRTRASLHERFVEWAEPVNRERGRETEFEEILGYHLEQAYRYRTELGPLDDETRDLGRRAAIKLAGAGRRADGRGDTHAAASLLARAVALLPPRDPFRVELLPELADAQSEIGDSEATVTSADAAVEEAAAIGDERLLARARLSRVFNSIWVPELAGADGDPITVVESLRETLASHGDEADQARAWRVLIMLHSSAGRYDEAAAASERTIEHASRAGDRRLLARGVAGYASTAVLSSLPVPELIERCEGLLPMVRGDRKSEAWVSQQLAQLYAMRGDVDQARELYRRCQAMFADLGPIISAMTTSISSARVELLAGDVGAAEAELRRDDAELEAIGERYYRSWIAGYLARVLWDRGNVDEADRYCTIASELVETDDVDGEIQWRSIRAKVLASRGDAEGARAMSDDAVALSAESTDLILRADVLVDRSETMQLLGETSLVPPALEEALRLYEAKGDLVSSARTQRALAEADRAEATSPLRRGRSSE